MRSLLSDRKGATVAMTKDADVPKDSTDRIITITGQMEEAADAVRVVYGRICVSHSF